MSEKASNQSATSEYSAVPSEELLYLMMNAGRNKDVDSILEISAELINAVHAGEITPEQLVDAKADASFYAAKENSNEDDADKHALDIVAITYSNLLLQVLEGNKPSPELLKRYEDRKKLLEAHTAQLDAIEAQWKAKQAREAQQAAEVEAFEKRGIKVEEGCLNNKDGKTHQLFKQYTALKDGAKIDADTLKGQQAYIITKTGREFLLDNDTKTLYLFKAGEYENPSVEALAPVHDNAGDIEFGKPLIANHPDANSFSVDTIWVQDDGPSRTIEPNTPNHGVNKFEALRAAVKEYEASNSGADPVQSAPAPNRTATQAPITGLTVEGASKLLTEYSNKLSHKTYVPTVEEYEQMQQVAGMIDLRFSDEPGEKAMGYYFAGSDIALNAIKARSFLDKIRKERWMLSEDKVQRPVAKQNTDEKTRKHQERVDKVRAKFNKKHNIIQFAGLQDESEYERANAIADFEDLDAYGAAREQGMSPTERVFENDFPSYVEFNLDSAKHEADLELASIKERGEGFKPTFRQRLTLKGNAKLHKEDIMQRAFSKQRTKNHEKVFENYQDYADARVALHDEITEDEDGNHVKTHGRSRAATVRAARNFTANTKKRVRSKPTEAISAEEANRRRREYTGQ